MTEALRVGPATLLTVVVALRPDQTLFVCAPQLHTGGSLRDKRPRQPGSLASPSLLSSTKLPPSACENLQKESPTGQGFNIPLRLALVLRKYLNTTTRCLPSTLLSSSSPWRPACRMLPLCSSPYVKTVGRSFPSSAPSLREHDLLTDLAVVSSTQTAEPDMTTDASLRGGFVEE